MQYCPAGTVTQEAVRLPLGSQGESGCTCCLRVYLSGRLCCHQSDAVNASPFQDIGLVPWPWPLAGRLDGLPRYMAAGIPGCQPTRVPR